MQDPPDFTNRYNTALSPADERGYQNWVRIMSAANGRDMTQDSFDYDMRGAFKAGAGQSDNGHMPDTFKKPNHPTFSDQSQYNGVDGNQGGSWLPFGAGRWAFQASPTNVQMHGADSLQQYFSRVEPNNPLFLPPTPQAQAPQPGVMTAPQGALSTPLGALSGIWQ